MSNTVNTRKPPPQLSIVFPNWNGAQDTLEYLQSIQNSSYPQEKLEVIMVDNGSEDKSVKLVKKHFSGVRIIELGKNYGPAYARNRGIEVVLGKFIFCSDNDQTLATNTLQIIDNFLRMNPEVGVIGAKVISKEEPRRTVSCGYTFNRWLGIESGLKDCDKIKECDWVAGCSMMFRKGLTDEIGLFCEKFFFFAEDADLCLRARKAGYKIVSLPDAVVYHPQKTIPQIKSWYYDYYKAKFRLILRHSTTLQKIASILLHMTVFSLIHYLTRKKEYVVLKGKALLEALTSSK